MNKITATVLLLALARQSLSVELSLEENRAQRGNIGFVDMRRVYRLFPDTVRAKEHFEEVVRQAEEQVGIRKADILRLKGEISRLKAEREALAALPAAPAPIFIPPPAPAPAAPEVMGEVIGDTAKVVSPTQPAQAQAPSGSGSETLSAAATLLTREGITVSTHPAQASDLDALLSTRPAVHQLPGLGAPTPGVVITTEVEASTPTIAAAPAASPAAAEVPAAVAPEVMGDTAKAVSPPQAPPVSSAIKELDEKIAAKTRDLEAKESDFKDHQAAAERNLLDLESRRTEILLGKIHKAVKEVSRREGISVVVDKGAILFGHEAVDLTEKVLKALKGP